MSSHSALDFGPAPHRYRDPRTVDAWTRRLGWLAPGYRPDDALIDRHRSAHFRGDASADALVDWMHERGLAESMPMFERALEDGIAAIASPAEPLHRFFRELDEPPPWLSRPTTARACRVAERATLGHGYVLFSVSLMAGYVSAGITKALVATGELERMAPRRIAETSKFVDDLYASPGMERTSEGFKSTIRVRLMHAFVRRKLLRSGWDVQRWGVPINQADMAGTVLSFSISYLLGLQLLGFVVTRAEREAVIHLWRYVGHLLGVEEALLAASEAESRHLLWLSAASQQGPDRDGAALSRALLTVPKAYRGPGPLGALLEAFDVRFCAGLTRFFVGQAAADGLELPDTSWKYAALLIAPLNLCGEVVGRVLPPVATARSRVGRALNDYRMRMLLKDTPVRFSPRGG